MISMLRWLTAATVFVQERAYEWGWGMHPMWWMGGAWGIGMMFMMFLFWILVIAGLVLGVRWLVSEGKERRRDSALGILPALCARRIQQGRVRDQEKRPELISTKYQSMTSRFYAA